MMQITVRGKATPFTFTCPVGWTVEEATNKIRKAYFLSGGQIQKNDKATELTDLVQEGDGIAYVFVGGKNQDQLCIDIADKIVNFLNDPNLGFPLCRQLFGVFKKEILQSEDISKEDDEFIRQSLDNLEIEVIGGETTRIGSYMEVKPNDMKIHISSDWLFRIRKGEIGAKEMKRHDHLLLIKSLHEVGHILTPIFMKRLETEKSKTRKRKRSENDVYVTPTNIGTTKAGRKMIGNAGYGLEELLCGGRMFHEQLKDVGMFTIAILAIEKRQGNERKRYEIPDAFLNSDMTNLEMFHVDRIKLKGINSKTSVKTRKGAESYPLSNCVPSNNTSFKPHGTSCSIYRRV